MTTPATKTAPAKTAPTAPIDAVIPYSASPAPWRLSEVDPAHRTDFLNTLTRNVDALRTMPKGLEKEDRQQFKDNASRARRDLIRVFPIVESMADQNRFTITVAVTVKNAEGEKALDRRPIRLTDAVYARLGLYGRTMESVGLA